MPGRGGGLRESYRADYKRRCSAFCFQNASDSVTKHLRWRFKERALQITRRGVFYLGLRRASVIPRWENPGPMGSVSLCWLEFRISVTDPSFANT